MNISATIWVWLYLALLGKTEIWDTISSVTFHYNSSLERNSHRNANLSSLEKEEMELVNWGPAANINKSSYPSPLNPIFYPASCTFIPGIFFVVFPSFARRLV
jgi:hypothetical protein